MVNKAVVSEPTNKITERKQEIVSLKRNDLPPPPDNVRARDCNGISRRLFLSAGIGVSLTGCIENPILSSTFNLITSRFSGQSKAPFNRKQITKLPYASMLASSGDGPQVLLILGRSQNAEQHWIAGGDRAAITLKGGRIVKTYGFAENLKQTQSRQPDPVDRFLHRLDKPLSHVRYIDISEGNQFGVPVDSSFERVGEEQVRILEIDFDTILVRERNQARTIRWSFDNYYWVDPVDGYIWKSSQHISRQLPPINYEILKPPADTT